MSNEQDQRITYHNRCICSDTGVAQTEEAMIAAFPRMGFDDCGNIVSIDGRVVTGGDAVYHLE